SMVDSIQDIREYYNLGLFESAPTIEELADKIGVNKENLVETVNRYVDFVKNGKDEDFGRPMLNLTFDEPPYYACKLTCHVQGTFGGIRTDTSGRVLNTENDVIPGLYAAGECASVGTYGANPMAVNIVFGRIAGESAAAYAQ
ncbi:MAG: FAD-binding protein, partial [bacterium]